MDTISVGPWKFEAPAEWELDSGDGATPYLESADKTMGCYIKAITFGEARESAEDAATYLQIVHERNFKRDPEANWKIVQRSQTLEGQLARSTVDMWDKKSNYRVLSAVLATASEALQVTIHDYWCTDYAVSEQVLAPVAASLRRQSGVA